MAALKEEIITRAKSLGFDLVGVASAHESSHKSYLESWLSNHYQGEMSWFTRNHEKRVNPAELVPDTKSIVCFAINYYNGNANPHIADYALGTDYHIVLKKRLKQLFRDLKADFPELEARWFTDSAPVLERYWAQQAGLGWIGKNTMLISRQFGSYLFLAEMLINIELEPDTPHDNFCGSCRRCLEACPTDAFDAEYQLNATQCISYLTIEKKTDFAADEAQQIGDHVFGCDVCQEVCPWNRFASLTQDPAFKSRSDIVNLSIDDIVNLTEDEYQQIFKQSAVKRTGFDGLIRNATIAQESTNEAN